MSFSNIVCGQNLLDQQIWVAIIELVLMLMIMIRDTCLRIDAITSAPYVKHGKTLLEHRLTSFEGGHLSRRPIVIWQSYVEKCANVFAQCYLTFGIMILNLRF